MLSRPCPSGFFTSIHALPASFSADPGSAHSLPTRSRIFYAGFRQLIVALINTGGIRAPLDPGDVTYEALYRVIPFNNHGVIIGPMPTSTLLKALTQSALTCGTYGALMQSGLEVQIEKNCDAPSNRDKTDPNARLTQVETLGGKVLLDTAPPLPAAGEDPMLTVVTLDFLATSGSGYDMFKGLPQIKDIGIVREAMKDALATAPATFIADIDGPGQHGNRHTRSASKALHCGTTPAEPQA
jgi:2',3'-cyclic-nucleotide 2'-phosphodiesterase (5'-nucleotidase family)